MPHSLWYNEVINQSYWSNGTFSSKDIEKYINDDIMPDFLKVDFCYIFYSIHEDLQGRLA